MTEPRTERREWPIIVRADQTFLSGRVVRLRVGFSPRGLEVSASRMGVVIQGCSPVMAAALLGQVRRLLDVAQTCVDMLAADEALPAADVATMLRARDPRMRLEVEGEAMR